MFGFAIRAQFKFLMIFRPGLYIIRVTAHSSGKLIMKQAAFVLLLISTLVLAANAQKAKPTPKIVKPRTPAKTTPAALPAKPCTGKNELTQAEITAILDKHNTTRGELGLPKLTWNCQLADTAQEWATRGIFEHRTTRLGENMYASSLKVIGVEAAFESWMSEKPFWNNDTATCEAGKVCTHYTQVVWRGTTEIGCGINRNTPGKWKTMMVCNYSPRGNTPGKAF